MPEMLALGALASMYHALATPEPPSSVSSHVGAVVSAVLPALLVLLSRRRLGVRSTRRPGVTSHFRNVVRESRGVF